MALCQSLKRPACLTVWVLAILMLAAACSSASQDTARLTTPEQLEAEAQSIDESLICPSCPGKTIGQAQVAQAAQMRLLVREKLAEGWTRQQILDYFDERYEGVLAEPPKQGFTLLAWVLPIIGMVGGGAVVYFVIRSMRHKRDRQTPAPDPDLHRYMARVDHDLGRHPAPGNPLSGQPHEPGDV